MIKRYHKISQQFVVTGQALISSEAGCLRWWIINMAVFPFVQVVVRRTLRGGLCHQNPAASSPSVPRQCLPPNVITSAMEGHFRGDDHFFCFSRFSGITGRSYQERLSRYLSMESSLWVLSLALRETPLPSVYLNMFTLPDQTLFLKVWIFVLFNCMAFL